MSMSTPSFIPMPWANEGQKIEIPTSQADSGRATWKVGFPPETAIPRQSGGIPPNRMDFQGVFNTLSSHAFFQQSGSLYTWNVSLDYIKGAHILGSDGTEYVAQQNSGPGYDAGAHNPVEDNTHTYWKSVELVWADKVYPVGSIYLSMGNTNPQLLFGGVWSKIGGRFLIGADNTYVAGTKGGSSSHSITVGEMPIHTHSVSVSEAGGHTHMTTVSTIGNHTHGVSVGSAGNHSHSATTSRAGDHSHNRGTMEISGQVHAHNHASIAQAACNGAFAWDDGNGRNIDTGGWNGQGGGFNFYASRSWTGVTNTTGGHNHTLETSESGNHSHSGTASAAGSHTHTVSNATNGQHSHTVTVGNTGGGAPFNTLPPYLVCYMWQRTA